MSNKLFSKFYKKATENRKLLPNNYAKRSTQTNQIKNNLNNTTKNGQLRSPKLDIVYILKQLDKRGDSNFETMHHFLMNQIQMFSLSNNKSSR